ncbi:TNT domain-containing protein [Kitasatospora sp. NPDC059571]|uniref:TNT domain-containing protein n=1 Tax=Kitasatospora sp. NPDC059571 TaxID=3346871 RepID=UPI0036B3D0B1
MRLRLLLAPIVAAAALVGPAVPAASAAPAATAPAPARTTPATECSAAFHDGDPRLGPEDLPTAGPVGRELFGYRRTGGLGEQQFLATYYGPTANSGSPGWIYPPADGYVRRPDGTPIEFTATLVPGQDIDRYGSEYGSFLAPEGLPYASRSIPPQSLDGTPAAGCNYHDYRVLKPFAVHSGPIAPWFAQPGLGLQYQLDGALVSGAPTKINVMWLVDNGYLQRLV